MIPRIWLKNGWTAAQFGFGLALVMVTIGFTWPAWRWWGVRAMQPDVAGYVCIVPILAAWLAWCRRSRLSQVQPRLTGAGVFTLTAGLLVYGLAGAELAVWSHATGQAMQPVMRCLGASWAVVGALGSGLGFSGMLAFGPALVLLPLLTPPVSVNGWAEPADVPGWVQVAMWTQGPVLAAFVVALGLVFRAHALTWRWAIQVMGGAVVLAGLLGVVRAGLLLRWGVADAPWNDAWLIASAWVSFWVVVGVAFSGGCAMGRLGLQQEGWALASTNPL